MYQYDSKDKYVAYVGTYTHGSSIGIHVYDLDVENGYMTEREVIPVNNASHVALSTSGKYLYSIADEGVAVMKINDDGVIEDVKFKTFGCGAAVATSSIATEMIKGKTVEEAEKLSNKAVIEALDGLPPAKIHCSVLAEEAVKAALKDYHENHEK